jgi:hypothetical protein
MRLAAVSASMVRGTAGAVAPVATTAARFMASSESSHV